MKSRLIKTLGAAYEPSAFTGENTSGTYPLNDMVLVLPDKAKNTMGERGLIHKTDRQQSDEQLAAETGVIIAIGDGAFNWSRDRMREYQGRKPAVGDRIFYQRYAGQIVIGVDNLEYRCMSDKEIALVQSADAPAAGAVPRTAKGITISRG